MSQTPSDSSPVQVRPVRGWWERRRFLHLPWDLYRGDACWVPPLRGQQKELVGYVPHAFYKRAEAQTFLAYRGGRPCGRIAAIVNHAHNERHNERRGFFGFFECIDDQEVANALFDAARAWLAEHGMSAMRGPANPSLNYECGLLIDGFDTPPTFMLTYNPPYYARLVEGYGFGKAQDMYAFYSRRSDLSTLDKKVYFVAEEAVRRFNVKVRPMNRARFKEETELYMTLYNVSLQNTWGFVPFSPEEIHQAAAGLKHLLELSLTSILEIDGKAVGAGLGLLDYNPLIKKIDGRLFPFGFLRLLWGRRSLKRSRLAAIGVLPEYVAWGLGPVIYTSLIAPTLQWGIEEVEYSWILESTSMAIKTMQRGGARKGKTWRLYDFDFPASTAASAP
jgi:hypothetical protein